MERLGVGRGGPDGGWPGLDRAALEQQVSPGRLLGAQPLCLRCDCALWLIKAGGLTVLLALFCGYLTLCWLFYQG